LLLILDFVYGNISMLLNAFRRIFSKAQNRKARRSYTCPQLLQLESRIVPANFQVTSLADTATGGTLREAIDLANTTAGNDTIGFAPSLFSSGAGTITLLTAQLPQILNASTVVGAGTRGTLTITGPGATTLTISGNNGVSDRNFHILSVATGGNLAISGVTFSGAKTTGAGGAIENAGTLTVSGSTITGNSANDGGGITNWGTLTVINTTISGNTSITQAGGGIQNSSGSLTVTNSTISGNTAATQAGGIQNNGILVVTNSTISGNTALTRSGGGIYNFTSGTLTLSGTTIAGNSANDGGGIRNLGALNISNTIIANSTSGGDFSGNQPGTSTNNLITIGTLTGATTVTSAQLNLGPLKNNAGPTFTMALLSGSVAIGAGNATISNAAPINKLDQRGINRTTSDIGAYSFGIQVTNTSDSNTVGSGSLRAAINLANTTPGDDQIVFNLTGVNTITLGSALPTIVSASTVVGSGTAGKTGINGVGASLLTISGSDPTNANNETRNFSIFRIASGGDFTISGVTVSGAITSGRGGAFKNSGTLTVINSTISGNTAGTGGGGIVNYGTLTVSNSTISGNTSNSGGGGIVNNSGTFSISNSTISGNTSSTGAGGGINNNNGGNLNIANSTISGNTAGTGGGIFNDSVTMVINSTISGNTAGTGGGINNNFGGTLNIANSIIANSITGGDYAGGGTIGTIGTIGTNSNILVEDGTLPGTSEITGDPNLGPLQNNGGTTFTMALGTGSVAIGAGDATISNDRPINGKDQRGVTRSPTTPSIGALEYILATQATLTTPAAGSASGSAFTTQPIITIKDTFGNTVNTNVSVTMTVSSGATTLGTTTINAVAGIATFTNVGISGIDGTPYTLTFTSTGLTIATQTITITTTFGTATQVILTTPALGSASGSAFTTQPVITIKDAAGNIVTNSTASVTMTVSSGATTVGTTTINAVAGIATFTNVGISGIAGTPYTLTFTSTGLTSATQSITPTFGTATQATLTTPALGSASGSAFTTQPVITIKDAAGNIVTNSTASVTMTVSSGATTLGITTINAVAGIATFTNVGISGAAGTSYTLTFTSGSLTATQNITPTFGIATQATLTSPALGSASGSAFTTQPVITIKDAAGNTVTNSTASVTMTVSSGATTVGTTTINAPAGIATFTNVGISGIAGTPYTLTFTSTGLTIATQSITPTFGTATQATLTTPAAGSASGSAFTTQPVITLKDTFGNTVNTNVSVTMTVSSGTTTVGTTTINAVAGVATFTNVGISGAAGTSYTLTFTSGSLTATQSIIPTFGIATQATITTQAAGAPSGSAFTTQPVITIKDAFGNTVTDSTASVTMAVSGANGLATTVGTTTINAVAGIATFAGVGISGTAGTPYTLTFTSTGLTIATQTITPTFGIATQAPLTTNPAGAPSGSAFTTQPVITIKDTFGNTVTNSTASVTMTVSSGDNKATTVGAFTINAVAGIATFAGVGISGTDGTSYTLTFTSGSFTATQSITATFGLATQAILTTPAAGSASGSAFTTQPVITIKDAFGNTVTNSTASVTMSVSSGDNKATTVGAFTINAVAGIATFTNVGISGTAGTPYTLTFISTGLTIPTQTITPTFGLATQATLTTPAAGAPSGLAFITQPVITINDTFGNPITNSTASVTMTVSSGATTVGTTTINAVAGIATFTNVGISGAAGNSYTLTFTSGSLATATQTITPAFGPAIQISSPSEPIPFPLGVSTTKDLVILTGINPATISGYVATIVWGDGSQNSAGTIALSPNQSGVFQVLGTHTYSSLELFNGSVSVTSVFDNRIFSSSFNVEVLTAAQKEKISDISAEVIPPGGKTADVTISGVINSFYKQSANNSSPVILFTASYVSNPQPYATAAPAQSFFDVRLRNPDPGAVLTLTANFSGGLQRGSSPYIQFAQDTSTSYQNVVSSNNLVVINYINNTITVLIDQNSFPLINNLSGTVFAVVTGATQVSSNTITVLPAAFTSGTAVGIAWGASSTLVDVATSANASNTTLTFQNSRKTTLSLAPSQSKGTVILRTVNNGGKTNEEASKETIKQLTNPDILQSIIRGTIGIGPEVIGGMIKKMLPENAGSFLKQWSKVVSEIKGVPNDMITSKVNAIPQTNNGSSTDKPEECDDTLLEDAVFDDISKISSALGLVDESIPCLNGVSLDSMLEELAFCGEINWAGLALSTLTLSQFRTFPKDNSKRVRPIKVRWM
jgi:hypothetical protein